MNDITLLGTVCNGIAISCRQQSKKMADQRHGVVEYKQETQLLLRRTRPYSVAGIAVPHVDYGYSRRRNFGGSLVHNYVLIYLP